MKNKVKLIKLKIINRIRLDINITDKLYIYFNSYFL